MSANEITMTENTDIESGYDVLLDALAGRDEWAPFVNHVRTVRAAADPMAHALSSQLMGWAQSHLGPSYAETLAEGYVRFVAGVNREQFRYEKKGRYPNRSYAEVYENVYDNDEFMVSYFWGVFVTTFAWAHHLPLANAFLHRFLPKVSAKSSSPRIVDLGCGSGLWSMLALDRLSDATSDAIDISTFSAREARSMSASLGLDSRLHVHQADALNWQPDQDVSSEGTYDAGISCFVLEHLETPEKLLQNLARQLAPRGVAFVTGALTAAECDHIFEFKKESELVAMAEDAGFRVVEALSMGPESYPDDGHFLPRSMALILSKRAGEVW
jgi:SAM-dependent methyltransferase